MNKMKSEDIWIFAYGSLCWRPGFEYEEMVLGHIKGFVRRFWQGNTVHRGTVEKVWIFTKHFKYILLEVQGRH